jgi:tRNA G46 methylase TrmB
VHSHHKYLLLLDGKLLLAPVTKNIETVLDIGTGTGIWAIDFADEFPETNIIGTDLSPIQPNLMRVCPKPVCLLADNFE